MVLSMSGVNIGWRVALAVFGGYALACGFAMALPPLLPLPLAQAVLTATLLGFVVHVVAALWCFAQPDLRRVAIGLLLPAAVLAAIGLLLAPGTA